MLFSILGTILLICMGVAVDFGRAYNARTQTWQALDAGVLAGARALQLNTGNASTAVAVAQAVYNENVKTRMTLASDTISFGVTDDGTSVGATGNASISTTFLRLAGYPELPVFTSSGGEFISKAKIAVGGNSQTNIEIAMMLDITGSMSGQKLADLKSAASKLIDIVVWKDQSEYTSRVALAPFTEAVNVGSAFAAAMRGSPAATYTYGKGKKASTFTLTNCVSERTGTAAYTDAAPSTAPIGTVYTWDGNCVPSSTIVPLTSDTTLLKNSIDGYQAQGGTAGHLGTAFAWYLLSPNWSAVWPAASQPGSYTDLTALNSYGQPKLRKIAVLMTDGDYNNQYCQFGTDNTVGINEYYAPTNCKPTNGDSQSQAASLCTNMKSAGITVYTVGFQVSKKAKKFLETCASGPEFAYDAQDGSELQQAFIDIALKVSTIYLSQ